MSRGVHSNVFAISSLVLALALSVVPVPQGIALFKPDWVAVLLIYWTITQPFRFGLFTAFAMGLALDVLTGDLLGQNTLALITVVFLSLRFHLRIRAFPVSQIVGSVIVMLALYQFILFWIDGVAGRSVGPLARIGPVVSGSILILIALVTRDTGERNTRTRREA